MAALRGLFGLALLLAAAGLPKVAHADAAQDCSKMSGDEAIAACTAAIQRNPKNADAYANRGVELVRSLKFDRALVDFDKAILINPRLSWVYRNRGNVKIVLGNFDGALADLTKAIELDPKDALAYKIRGGPILGKVTTITPSPMLRRGLNSIRKQPSPMIGAVNTTLPKVI